MFVKNSPPHTIEEEKLEVTLRPLQWNDYIGQEKLKGNLRIIMEAAKQRREPLEHLLFYGNSGLGKTSLAQVLAREMETALRRTTGPVLERAADIASVLTNLGEKEILFIDEIHRIGKTAVETLYSAMEDFRLHLLLGRGPMARTMDLQLPRFTLIGATTRISLLPPPFRNRFGAVFQLGFYEQQDMKQIIQRSAGILGVKIEEEALGVIAARSRFTPRVANRLLKRVRDFAMVDAQEIISKDMAQKALGFLGIDELGLEESDRKIFETIISTFSGGPVGIEALAAATGEEIETILDIYEPYLLQLGFLERTRQGRIVTRRAYQHLKK